MTTLAGWTPRPAPELPLTEGRTVVVAPWDSARHGAGLFAAIGGPENALLWRHLASQTIPETAAALSRLVDARQDGPDPWRTHVLLDLAGSVLGMASYMRIRPEHGSVEVGFVVFAPTLQRTPAATEAMVLMARYVFEDLGYRRYEWKCDNANAASKRAAERLGFTFEGVFRQDLVVRGRNRDTAWFSLLDHEWPQARAAFEAWLDPANFDADGRQRQRLAAIREALSGR